jgi:hypothetical protein
MTTIPCSSDAFSYLVAQRANAADYGASFIRAIDACQRFAERSGLVEKWGQDEVQRHLAAAFKHMRRGRRR